MLVFKIHRLLLSFSNDFSLALTERRNKITAFVISQQHPAIATICVFAGAAVLVGKNALHMRLEPERQITIDPQTLVD